jgi:signal transduction histidine kinase
MTTPDSSAPTAVLVASQDDERRPQALCAEEQAALRRVATLVARDVPSDELFAAVAGEVGGLLGADLAGMIRYEPGDTVTPVATWAADGEHPPVPDRWATEEGDPTTMVAATRRPARVDDWTAVPGPIGAFIRDELHVRSSVGSPILVEGRLWGALAVHSRQSGPLPPDTEARLHNFTELVATAVSNVQTRAEMQRLADELAALRRVATLVARESPPAALFAAVAEEVGRLLEAEAIRIVRYEVGGAVQVVASWGEPDAAVPVGTHLTLGDHSLASTVRRTARPARIDDHACATATSPSSVREPGIRSAVGTPIVVEGRLWGVMIAASPRPEPLPAGTEERIGKFTELMATAISNIQARSDLAASRARIVAATDSERRRVVRDLHDGAQQRLVTTVMTLKLAYRALERGDGDAVELVGEALGQAERATDELRELVHGILPSVLAHGGLRAGVEALARRMRLPVEVGVAVGRLPRAVEASAYFLVAEALTNVAKHSRAGRAAVTAHIEDGTLQVRVRDDGVGGARADGSGLLGLADRLAALDGRLDVESPADGGTLVAAAIPLPG